MKPKYKYKQRSNGVDLYVLSRDGRSYNFERKFQTGEKLLQYLASVRNRSVGLGDLAAYVRRNG